MAGLFFYLASAEGAGLLLCPAAIQPHTSGYNTTCPTLERITAPGRPPAHTQIPAPRRTLHSLAQPPYYNKVYKVAAVRPCYGSMPDGAAYRKPCQPSGVSVSTCTGSAWHPPPGRAVQRQGRGGRRGTIDGLRRISFRAFAR